MPERPGTITAHIKMAIEGAPLEVDITVPNASVRLGELIPIIHSLADAVIGTVVNEVEKAGGVVSCKAGCGACCRQLVPIAEVEAKQIRDLVERLPEPRRSEIRRRFADARTRLEAAGMLEPLRNPDRFQFKDRVAFGLSYFAQQIACPFLEEESCSIHADRPIACREYLVTSPAVNCATPSAETIERIRMPRTVWGLLLSRQPDPKAELVPWVPLVLAPEWADAHPDDPPPRPATDWVGDAIGRLARTAPPGGPPSGEVN